MNDAQPTQYESNNVQHIHNSPEQKSTFMRDLLEFLVIAVLIVIPVRLFIAQPYIVSGASMDPTLKNGQYLIVDQLNYRFNEPERGDVIVFRYPAIPTTFFLKRIVGLPQETVIIEDNVVRIVNDANPEGRILDETYLVADDNGRDLTMKLLDNEYFVMGDNRPHSSDSRSWGPLQKDLIIGRVFIRLLPVRTIDLLPGEHNW